MKLLREANHLLYLALTLNNLGNVALMHNDYAQAEEYLQECYLLWQQLGDEIEMADTLGMLADIAAASGRRKTAVTLYGKALAFLSPYRDQQDADKLAQDIARRQEDLVDEKKEG